MSWHPRQLFRGIRLGYALLILAVALLAGLSCMCDRDTVPGPASPGPSDNLLEGRMPTRSEGVRHEERLTDGICAENGDHWKTDVTAVFRSSQSLRTPNGSSA